MDRLTARGLEPEVKLIEIAARLTDREAGHSTNTSWLRAFRRNFRHLAVTYGLHFNHAHLSDAEKATDSDLP